MFFKPDPIEELAEFSRNLELARRESDPGKRLLHYQEADRMVIELGLIPLTYGRDHLLEKPWVHIDWGIYTKLEDVVLQPC